jgi:hypothetical protein
MMKEDGKELYSLISDMWPEHGLFNPKVEAELAIVYFTIKNCVDARDENAAVSLYEIKQFLKEEKCRYRYKHTRVEDSMNFLRGFLRWQNEKVHVVNEKELVFPTYGLTEFSKKIMRKYLDCLALREIEREEATEYEKIEREEATEYEKMCGIEAALENLEMAQAFGPLLLENIRAMKRIDTTDLKRVLSCMEIEDLRPEDVNDQNAGSVLEAIGFIFPRAEYGKGVYHCTFCGEDVPEHRVIYPNRAVVMNSTIHKQAHIQKMVGKRRKRRTKRSGKDI